MAFPVTYSGKVDFTIDDRLDLTSDMLLVRIKEGLKNHRAGNVILHDDGGLSFTAGIRSIVTNWSVLTAISSGVIRIESSAGTLSVAYRLRFTGILILSTLVVASLWYPIKDHFHGLLPQSLLVLFVIWVCLFGGNYLWAVCTFSSFIRKVAGSTDHDRTDSNSSVD